MCGKSFLERRLTITVLLISIFMVSSCSLNSANDSDTVEINEPTQSVISLDELPSEVTESEYIEPIDQLSLYLAADCEFTIDGNHVEARYDDGLYAIDYDFYYHDYDVSQVSIFSVDNSTAFQEYRNSELPDGWQLATSKDSLFIYDSDTDVCFPGESSCASAIVDSVVLENIDINESIFPIFNVINNYIDCFPYVIGYEFTASETISLSNLISIYSRIGNDLLADSESCSVTKYIMREQLEGLPVSISDTNLYLQNKVHFNELYGSIPSGTDRFTDDFYNSDESVVIDVVYTNFENIVSDGDRYSVYPLEQCVEETILPVIREITYPYPADSAHVYFAELIYLPFGDGYIDITDFDYDIKLVPVWAFYYYSEHDDQIMKSGAVYVNAITGEPVTRRMTVE